MEFKEIGDTITQSEFNALVYLLRKFKRLTTTLKIGSSDLTSDFGNYHFTSGFKNFGANWIITDDVTVTSDDVLKNCYYSFIFTVIDVNLSGEVNRRLVTVDSESTGDEGTLEVIIPSDLIAENEVILPDFNVEVVFDEHEYYTPLPSVEFDISINKRIIVAEESVVITGVLTEKGETLPNKIVNLNVGGTVHRLTTDNQGKITYTYTGTGNKGRVIVSAFDEVAWFYDGLDGLLTVTCVKPRIAFGAWLVAEGDVLVDWGDGLSQITQSRGSHLSHDYTDGVTEHIILLDGNITRLGDGCFYSSRAFESITYVGIPDSVTSLGESCFEDCRSINKMVIPKSITNIGVRCFKNCFISDYQLYWTKNPVPYSTSIYSTNNNPKFTIPYGTMQLYIEAGYPAANLVERPIEADTINITSTKDILSSHDSESATITATLSDEDIPIPNTELEYTIVDKDDNLLDDGTVTTDANGEASIVYTASGVGDVTVTFSLRSLLQKTYELEDVNYYDDTLTDKSSNYATKLVSSITHSTDYYQVATTSSSTLSTYMSTVLIQNLTIPSHFKVTCEMMFPDITASSGTHEIGVGLFETNGTSNAESMIDLMSNQSQKGLIVRDPWGDNRANGKLSRDIWYTMELEYDGNVATAKILNGSDTVWSGNISSSKTINNIGLCTLGRNSSYKFRKLKVKAL